MTTPIRLLLSDVDGTLVTQDKRITPATHAAIRRLGEAGIGFTITSSRPQYGMRHLIDELELRLPVGAFNGGVIAEPDGTIVESHRIPEDAARKAIAFLGAQPGVETWVYTDREWLASDPDGAFVPKERHTIRTEPTITARLDAFADRTIKIVAASNDHDRLAECERYLQTQLAGRAEAARSQPYYLDVTPPGLDKGTVLHALSRRLGIAPAEIAAIGDMNNDVAMLRLAGLPIAMGNGSEAAKAAASVVSRSNEEDGFAYAVEQFILGR